MSRESHAGASPHPAAVLLHFERATPPPAGRPYSIGA
jgi:hypothetical protein